MHEILRYLNGKTFLGCSGREIFSEEYMGEDEDRNGTQEGLTDSSDQ